MALLELAERCEQATDADAELSKDIHEAIGNCVHRETEYYCIEDGNDCDSGFTCKGCGRDTYGQRVPAYTASLDAAMTLVPEGFRWWFSCGNIRPTGAPPEAQEAFAKVWQSTTAEHDLWRGDNCATPALALCAAALRARAGQQP